MILKTYILLIITLLTVIGTQVQAQYVDTVCTGDVGVIYGIVPEYPSSYIQWYVDGGTIVADYGDSIVVDWGNTGGDFTLRALEISITGCQSDMEYADVLVVPPPDTDLADATICDGDTYEIDAGIGFTSYLWQDGSGNRRFYADLSGTYSVEVTDNYGCLNSESMLLTVNPIPFVDLGPDTALCNYDEGLILNAGGDGLFYRWSSGEVDSIITIYPLAATYSVEVADVYGCIASDTINILACIDEDDLIIPTFITPNNDERNDVWEIQGLEQYPDAVVNVFSRWGTKVYESNGYNTSWNGKHKGQDLPMDSYYYVIDLNNGSKPYVGTITIVR